ncbi:hypothetical protein AXG93_1881s1420 [Marchantia polymorpha subsp. ruderalis]|uniref:LisH domain-containing protein n=1 Tax=Marchantia polymorpha subsp. ruderalis TaxID=1480154 RepID=A0A176W492_MARPO|nr:hypothetical protein AXG93_1881s1420 [Marchantia polymorpha subsp. ruderalis]
MTLDVLEAGLVELSHDEYVLATVMLVKKDVHGNYKDRRMCGDYRHISQQMKYDKYVMPTPEEIFDVRKMPLRDKVGDIEVPKIKTVGISSSEKREHQERELTVQPQVEGNQSCFLVRAPVVLTLISRIVLLLCAVDRGLDLITGRPIFVSLTDRGGFTRSGLRYRLPSPILPVVAEEDQGVVDTESSVVISSSVPTPLIWDMDGMYGAVRGSHYIPHYTVHQLKYHRSKTSVIVLRTGFITGFWGRVSASSKMEEDQIDKAVLAYLKKKGYRAAELAFQDDQNKVKPASSPQSAVPSAPMDPVIANQIFFYSRHENSCSSHF